MDKELNEAINYVYTVTRLAPLKADEHEKVAQAIQLIAKALAPKEEEKPKKK